MSHADSGGRRLVTGCLLFLLSLQILVPANAKKEQGPVISRITIRATDIFDLDTQAYLRRFPYTWINLLHIQTKQFVIEQELLFKVGERVDPFLLRETERNLRALSFIRAARVARFPQRDGTEALVVYVNDSWTTEPQLNLGGQNKVDNIEVGLKEKNFLGLGKSVQMLYNKDSNDIERTYKYEDPRLFQSRFRMVAEYVSKSDGEERRALLNRPFYSADTPYSIGGNHDHVDDIVDVFENNVKVSEINQIKEINDVFISRKLGGGRDNVFHGGLRYARENLRYKTTDKTTRAVPDHRKTQTAFIDMEIIRNKFIDLTGIEKMNRVEDFNLGPIVKVSPGFTPRWLTGQKDTTQLVSDFEENWVIKQNHFMRTKLRFSGRDINNRSENRRYSGEFRFYHRGLARQTILFHTRVDAGDKLDPDNLVRLGSKNGMRAYKEDEFVGTKSWVANLEDRIFLLDEMFHLVSMGAVVFYDVGYAWEKGEAISVSDLKSSVGAGLRFALTKSSNEVIVRMDVSYRLQKTPAEDADWVFSFGSGQAF